MFVLMTTGAQFSLATCGFDEHRLLLVHIIEQFYLLTLLFINLLNY